MSSQKATQAANAQSASQAQLYRGVVKQVISGDCLVIRSLVVKDGKNLEKQVMLSNITAPRLARRANTNNADSGENDQPYAFEAREFLRKKLIGKEVCFVKEASTQSNMDRGTLYLGKDTATGENINEALVSSGLVEVRRLNKPSDEENKLVALEEQAKQQGVGKWSKDPEADHVRQLKSTIENASNFVDSFRQKPIDCIVEYVRDGSTLRVLLVPSYHNITVQLSGIKCPGFKREGDQEVPEAFAEEAKQFVETRLLQRDVKLVLEGVANQSNGILLGTLLHPNGNISEFLLKEGLAKCVDWSMGVVTSGAEKYRTAERQAKQAKLRLWKNYTQLSSASDEAGKTLTGKVVEVSNGDALVLKLTDNSTKRVFLSSIRPPRTADFPNLPAKTDKKGTPLYDVPYLFEAREFMRKKLIGKKVTCTVDYVQPKSDDYQEKVCCTVMLADTNIAEAMVSQGLAKVIRYKQDDDQRSSKYDELLAAESRAQKKGVGLHSTKEPGVMRIADVSGDVAKAKQFLPLLQRAGRIDGLVEFVFSGSRFKLYLPKETCLITFLLSGIDCPRMGRAANGNNPAQPADEFGEEAFLLSKGHCLQHEVKVEIENVDKAGNFIGQLTTSDGVNLSVALVEAGYASVFRSAAGSSYYALLNSAEQRAKEKKLNRWKNFVEEKVVVEEAEKNEPQERVVNQKKLVITEVNNELHIYGQLVENGPKLEQLTTQLRAELEARPPVPGAYTPKVGDLCVAKFSMDNEWYRARVLSTSSNGNVAVLFIDYGNKEQTQSTKLAQIPAGFESLPAQAHEYGLALVQMSNDEDDIESAIDYLKKLLFSDSEAEFSMNVEYKLGNIEFITLYDSNKNDIGKKLVTDGFVFVDKARRERRLQKMLTEYMKSLSLAKQAHRNMWRYGDKEQDDAAEFGMTRR
jgi:staphylococcal nuclease domain-containing protein 1